MKFTIVCLNSMGISLGRIAINSDSTDIKNVIDNNVSAILTMYPKAVKLKVKCFVYKIPKKRC